MEAPRLARRVAPRLARALRFAAAALACAAATCVLFFALLSVWGLAAAPFARLRSSSFVIVASLALSAAGVIAAYGALYRRLKTPRAGSRAPRR